MSELDEVENKLSAVILQVQEGKTNVCITYITSDPSNKFHIVLTMNTLKSGMQFFGRLKSIIGPKNIIVFNSDKNTAEDCHHAKDVSSIMIILNKYPHIKVIICCAHERRFRHSIHHLLALMNDSITFSKKKIDLHIDEGHKYIKQNREDIVVFNKNIIVKNIIGYSGTPYPMWGNKKDDSIFHKILVRDIEKELGIIRSPEYFGSKDCEFFIIEEEITHATLINDDTVPKCVLVRSNIDEGQFYGDNYYFDLGNEKLLFGYLKYVLPKLNIDPDTFSFHFTPAYKRLLSHYMSVEIILGVYPTANVIVINGNGTELYRIHEVTKKSERIITDVQIFQAANKEEKKKLQEPSYMIQQLIKKTPNSPTFITGFKCVEMSVSLINEEIGNFDTCIMAHHHFEKNTLRQLCRPNFNYSRWSHENKLKIKKTKFYSLTKLVADTCLKYEEDVERINLECTGKFCTLNEIQGFEPEELTPREIKYNSYNGIVRENDSLWKPFKVYDGNDNEQWKKATEFYEHVKNKKLVGKSKPTLIDGFWCCTTTGKKGRGRKKHTVSEISSLKTHSWWSTFQLVKNQFTYARIFVGYEDLDDPSEYTISIKYVLLQQNVQTIDILNKYTISSESGESDDSSSDE